MFKIQLFRKFCIL